MAQLLVHHLSIQHGRDADPSWTTHFHADLTTEKCQLYSDGTDIPPLPPLEVFPPPPLAAPPLAAPPPFPLGISVVGH